MQGRRATDAKGIPLRDRARYLVTSWGRLLWGTFVIAVALWSVLEVHGTDSRSAERDIARAYQRCIQIAPLAVVEQIALDSSPRLRAEIQRREPGLLTPDGRLDVPDCARTYPRGALLSRRYPDIAPTRDVRP